MREHVVRSDSIRTALRLSGTTRPSRAISPGACDGSGLAHVEFHAQHITAVAADLNGVSARPQQVQHRLVVVEPVAFENVQSLSEGMLCKPVHHDTHGNELCLGPPRPDVRPPSHRTGQSVSGTVCSDTPARCAGTGPRVGDHLQRRVASAIHDGHRRDGAAHAQDSALRVLLTGPADDCASTSL